MPSLHTAIEIQASRQQVWQALCQKQHWWKWNSFLYDRDPGLTFQLGQSVSLSLCRLPGEVATMFQAKVTVLQPRVCLQWIATAPGFMSEHSFELLDAGAGRTTYIHRQMISGRLTRIFLPFIRREEHQGMVRMAQQLKRYLEEEFYDRRADG
ncbi:hypothetical protein DO97_09045 [Neosynechococcus sphagnicola sy1]|uniref:Polyketide cyclase n=1 Tax=Neosynechococcus sphagnicola sy1 TaxID=1497020 RepID=A0A098TNH6_9CYAN|nr:SRPBCC domain-containing protein [Neosynechococcus sphagnicola]KGF72393.1 hypothetical protein DO97_09045 [Neosynechococcus sphagnicola sy1]